MHCVVTGAAAGIGLELAKAYAREEYTITGVDVDRQRGETARGAIEPEGGEAEFVIEDLIVPEGRDRTVAALRDRPPVDVLVHCAGISAVGRLPETDLDDQLRVIDLNLTAPIEITAALLEAGRFSECASIVFVSSLSHFVGYPGASVYAATKDGIASYARSLRCELRSQGIHVMTVFPGPTRTEHARRYSPDTTREASRMDPAYLARMIVRGVSSGRRELVPGVGNRMAAFVGRWLPGVTERAMVKAILDRIQDAGGGLSSLR